MNEERNVQCQPRREDCIGDERTALQQGSGGNELGNSAGAQQECVHARWCGCRIGSKLGLQSWAEEGSQEKM